MRIWGIVLGLVLAVGCARQGEKPGATAEGKTPKNADPYFYVVRSHLRALNGRGPEALEDAQRAFASDPEDPSLNYLLAERLVEAFRFDEAKEAIQKTLALKPGWEKPLLLRAALMEHEGVLPGAEKIYRGLIRAGYSEENIAFRLAENLAEQKKFRAAIRVLRLFMRRNGESLNAHYYIATIQNYHLQELGPAAESYRSALALDADNPQLRNHLAQIYLRQKKTAEALEQYLQMAERNPFDLGVKLQIASLMEERGEIGGAIDKLEEVVEINPNADKIHYFLGVLLEKQKRFAEAQNHFARIPDASELYTEAIFHRTALYHLDNKLSEVVTLLEEAIAMRPQTPQFYRYLAMALEESGDLKKGIAVLRKGIRNNPNREELHFDLSILLGKNRERPASLAEMRRVIGLNPDHAEALNYIGYLYAEAGENLEEALAMIEKANQLKPGNGYIIDSLGWVHFRLGDVRRAESHIRRALKISPEEPAILEHMGDILLQQGKKERAVYYYRQAVRLGERSAKPNRDEIERAKQKIKNLAG